MCLTSRKLTSYKRAEKLCQELRFQLCKARTTDELDIDAIFKRLSSWMAVTGKHKYERPQP